jgi:NAD(P)H-dependent flavin oxidoreductase YrpB (nitropropane dioxygenase family)
MIQKSRGDVMIKSRLCDRLGIKYPIMQAGMGPFSNNNLCVATANAGVLGRFPQAAFSTKMISRGFTTTS